MAEGNLTFDEFWKLTESERCKRYKDLSEQDRYRVRLSMIPCAKSVLCNDCVHYHGYARCDAFPEGIAGDHITMVENDPSIWCSDGIRFEKAKED